MANAGDDNRIEGERGDDTAQRDGHRGLGKVLAYSFRHRPGIVYSRHGLTIVSPRIREKSRSADHSSRMPFARQMA